MPYASAWIYLYVQIAIRPTSTPSQPASKAASHRIRFAAVGAESDRVALAVSSKPGTIIMQSHVMSCLCTWLFVWYPMYLMCVICASDMWICVFHVLLQMPHAFA